MDNLDERLAAARRTLEAAGQAHVLKFYDLLDAPRRDALLAQVEGIDWRELTRLARTHVQQKPAFRLPENVEPAPWYPYAPSPELKEKYAKARKLGEDLIRQGRVAAFTVAGGQGTRLGWDGPKGSFPATPIRQISLFESMAEYIRKTQEKYGCSPAAGGVPGCVPWYIMTSPINDADTRAFFAKHDYFGLAPANVILFPQAMMPALDAATGKVLLETESSLALSPNGHGGSLKALWTSGAIADMQKRGVEQISYTQVDNPIVKVVDPLFLGLHALDGCEMSSKMLPKREPLEKLGNFCLVDGKMTVIEYSDLPDALAYETLSNGELRFRAGSIAIHALRVDFVASLNQSKDGFALPFHRADKKVACLDPHTGKPVTPTANNAVKLETFVFDALPLTSRSIIYETDRVEEFSPIKNADASPLEKSVDSPHTSRLGQTERAARWLESRGVKVARKDGQVDAVVEISQITAVEAADLPAEKLPREVAAGARLLL
jgi:UDP-N-acetylglucosamine/UDP-N-acetylgalactosamine diphosphorylase